MMKFVAHNYQKHAIDYILSHNESALLLDMGLGKTVITLTAVSELIYERFEVSKVLVVAPLRVARDTWPAEIEKWEHLRKMKYSVAVGSEGKRIQACLLYTSPSPRDRG